MKPLHFCLLLSLIVFQARAQIITTVAGNIKNGTLGDGGPATAARITPVGVAVDSAGNIYIADAGNARIRKVGINGIITTFAGGGVPGFPGDGGPATSASLGLLEAVKIDAHGNVFTVESSTGRVRKIDKNGIITTVAGGGTGGDGGPATAAALFVPSNIAFDKTGNMYIACSQPGRIRKVDTSGIISTIAGNGGSPGDGDNGPAITATLYNPVGLAVNNDGEIFIAASESHRIRKIDKNGIISTFAGTGIFGYAGDGGKARNATMSQPFDVVIAASGDVFVADFRNNVVRKITPDSIISTIAGTGKPGYGGDGGPAVDALFNGIESIMLDKNRNLFIAEYGNHCIRKITGVALPLTLLSFTGGLHSGNARLQWQTAMEENTSHFNIMRSSDGISFVNAGSVTAAGNTTAQTSYTFNDAGIASLHANTIFYKLYCVNKDGTGFYSKTIQLGLSPAMSLLAWPNPAQNILYVNVNGGRRSVQLSMCDAAGRVVGVINVPANSTAASFNTAGLKAGVYFVSTIIDGKKYEQKFIKE